MPELPEVETVKNTLILDILNKTILSIEVRYDKIIKNVSASDFIDSLVNQTFNQIKRKGKYLIFELDDFYLVSHLRMEGKYFLMHDEAFDKHDHIIFNFKDDSLRYNDTRKFGTMHLFKKTEDIYSMYPLCKVGYEPFDKEMNKDYLFNKIHKKALPIKSTLLDQSIIAGLGNIYVDEVLFLSKIHPLTLSSKITKDQCEELINNSIVVLNKAIALGGTTIRSFKSSHDISGRFQNELLIHTKEKCPNCGSLVKKIRVGGRGTYICEQCQK